MNLNIMGSLAELANLKQLDKEKLTEIIKDGLYQAISKKMILDNELEITNDYNTNKIIARFNRIVVERDTTLGEISLEDAKMIDEDLELGDKISVEMNI